MPNDIREILALSESIMVIYGGEMINKVPRSECDYDTSLGISMIGRRVIPVKEEMSPL